MTCSSRSVQRSMVWVWRLRTRTASRRISQVGHWCASWKTGVRRSLVSSSTVQVNGSYDRHSRRLSILCASARQKTTTRPVAPHGVASVRLFDGQNAELTYHIPLLAGVTTRIEARLYAPDGAQVMSVPGATDATFAFTPDRFASVTTVVGQPLDRDVT